MTTETQKTETAKAPEGIARRPLPTEESQRGTQASGQQQSFNNGAGNGRDGSPSLISDAAFGETIQRFGQAFQDTLTQTLQGVLTSMVQATRDVSTQANDASRRQQAQGFVQPGQFESGVKGLNGLVEGIVLRNLRATEELFQISSPLAYIDLQQRFVREYCDTLMQGVSTLAVMARSVQPQGHAEHWSQPRQSSQPQNQGQTEDRQPGQSNQPQNQQGQGPQGSRPEGRNPQSADASREYAR